MVLVLAVVFYSLLTVGIAIADPGDTLLPRQKDLPLYEQPDRSSAVVRRLRMSDRLLEFRRVGGWVRVATHGVMGWGWVPADQVGMEHDRPGQRKSEVPREPDATGNTADLGSVRFPLRLDVEGSPAMEIRGECRLVTLDNREVRWKFADTVPMQYKLEAVAAACRVDKKDRFGRLRVHLVTGDHSIAWATTAAPYTGVHVRSGGPWGPPAAGRGLGAIIVPKVRSVAPY